MMQFGWGRTRGLVVALAAFLTAPSALLAQDSEGINKREFGDWMAVCREEDGAEAACRLVQEQSRRDTGDLVARLFVVPVREGGILIAQVPIGVYLPGGAVYRFAGDDQIEQREMIWQRCGDAICEAALALGPDEITLFEEAEAIVFGYRMDAGADPIILRVDVSQFAEGFEAISATVE